MSADDEMLALLQALQQDNADAPPLVDDDDDDDEDALAALRRPEATAAPEPHVAAAAVDDAGVDLPLLAARRHPVYRRGEMEEGDYDFGPEIAALRRERADAAVAPVTLTPAPPSSVAALAAIEQDAYDTAAWASLLRDASELPLSRTRPLWQRFCLLFPTHAAGVTLYLSREVDEERRLAGTAPTKSQLVRQRLRVLDGFHRHLPLVLCSARLHLLFVEYTRDVVGADPVTLDDVCRTALLTVGRCLDATPLWRFYLTAYTTANRRSPTVVQWARKLYHQWLSVPLLGLEEAYQEYADFEASQRGTNRQLRLEHHLEERFKRARTIVHEKCRLWEAVRPSYLPRPLAPLVAQCAADETAAHHGVPAQQEHAVRSECLNESLGQWRAWAAIIEEEGDIERQGLPPAAHAQRMAFVLRQRLCCFPHEPVAWSALAQHHARHMDAAKAVAVLRDAVERFPTHVPLTALLADLLAHGSDDAAGGNAAFVALMRGIIAAVKQRVVTATKQGDPAGAHRVELHALRGELTSAAVAWAQWAFHAVHGDGGLHMRTVARHCVAKCNVGRSTPFLAHWAAMELRLAKNPAAAVGVLDAWARLVLENQRRVREALVAMLHDVPAPEVAATGDPLDALEAALGRLADVAARAVAAVSSAATTPPDPVGGKPMSHAERLAADACDPFAAEGSVAAASGADALLFDTAALVARQAPAHAPAVTALLQRMGRGGRALYHCCAAWASDALIAHGAPAVARAFGTRGAAGLRQWVRAHMADTAPALRALRHDASTFDLAAARVARWTPGRAAELSATAPMAPPHMGSSALWPAVGAEEAPPLWELRRGDTAVAAGYAREHMPRSDGSVTPMAPCDTTLLYAHAGGRTVAGSAPLGVAAPLPPHRSAGAAHDTAPELRRWQGFVPPEQTHRRHEGQLPPSKGPRPDEPAVISRLRGYDMAQPAQPDDVDPTVAPTCTTLCASHAAVPSALLEGHEADRKLRSLVARLPTAHGCVERFGPFVSGAHGGAEHKRARDDGSVPTTEWLAAALAATPPLFAPA